MLRLIRKVKNKNEKKKFLMLIYYHLNNKKLIQTNNVFKRMNSFHITEFNK